MKMEKDSETDSDNKSRGSMEKMDMEDPLPPGENEKVPYPKGVFFIMATELAERFSYYGMRAVLTIYMRNELLFSENDSTSYYHVFLMLCYGLPIFWGVISDSWLGKFKTILYVSVLFAAGNIILALSSVPQLNLPKVAFFFVGLIGMAVGTAGMKPCVAPLGGEQYKIPQQVAQLQYFFSIFFFVVTIGNMISTIITPIFRRDIQCFGMENCYPLAFGVPASTMVAAIVIFAAGRSKYIVHKPNGNMLVKVVKCVAHALTNRKEKSVSVKTEDSPHWLDRASDVFDEATISDTKGLFRILPYFIPVPMFYALYEQLGSRWTLQATRMNGRIGNFSIKPDQMQVSNAILMFVSLPFFNWVVYPLLGKMGIKLRSLQRMVIGGLLASLSFGMAGIVAMKIDPTIKIQPSEGNSFLTFANDIPCPITVTINPNTVQEHKYSIDRETYFMLPEMKYTNSTSLLVESLSENCSATKQHRIPSLGRWQGEIEILPNVYQTVTVTEAVDFSISVRELPFEDDYIKSKDGNARVKFIIMEDPTQSRFQLRTLEESPVRFKIKSSEGKTSLDKTIELQRHDSKNFLYSITEEIDDHTYDIIYETPNNVSVTLKTNVNLENGGSYNFIAFLNPDNATDIRSQLVVITPPNSVHILWLVPQYVLMAWGEILFIVSGMEFAYTEAPVSLKSVVQAIWHLMNAVGNVIVIISAQSHGGSSQTNGFFIFGGLMLLDSFIYYLMARRYKYVAVDNSAVVMH